MIDIVTSAGGFLLALAYIFLGYVLGYIVTDIRNERLREDYLDAATSLWLAASMACCGANRHNDETYLIYEEDYKDLEVSRKKMEEAMRKYERDYK